MTRERNDNEPFGFWLVKHFLIAEDDQSEEPEPVPDRLFYGTLAIVTIGLAVLGLTIGLCSAR